MPTSDRSIRFAPIDGRESSQAFGRRVFSSAVRFVDADLADRIEATKDWRKSYLEPVRKITEVGARSAKDALRIASDGLDALHANLLFARDGVEGSLREAIAAPGEEFHTAVIEGKNSGRARDVAIPYGGQILRGDALKVQLDKWTAGGIIEESCAEAVRTVIAQPEWLDLSDSHFALLGAASEMGPLEWLCRWGGNVYAIDIPGEPVWERVTSLALAGSGRVMVPLREETTSDTGDIIRSAGTDLMIEAPELRAWLSSFATPMVIGNYVYADGSTFVRLAAVADALIAEMIEADPTTTMAYLVSPTDVFAVPREVVEEARARGDGAIKTLTRTISMGNLFVPSYRTTVQTENGTEWGIYDCLVPQQGANYALAKNLQKWRAVVARESGVRVSANIAPATRTRSVVKNKILSSAYAGARPFGVEIFEPETSRALMATLLVHDLRNPQAAGGPSGELSHPYELFAEGAAHGGLWRLPHEPRTVLPLAVGIGLLKR